MDHQINRRTFIRRCVGAAALATAAQTGLIPVVNAADLPLVTEDDPMAVTLGYVAEAARADKAKYPKYEAGQECAGCIFYTGPEGSAQGPCGVFPGKAVVAGGWCSTWTAKP